MIAAERETAAVRESPVMRARPETEVRQVRPVMRVRPEIVVGRDRPASRAEMVMPHHVRQASIAIQIPILEE